MTTAKTNRQIILENAFELIYKKGYQTTSIDEIIATTKVTKGSFYYHFKTKDKMGIAMVNEIIKPIIQDTFVIPLSNTKKPLEQIYLMTKSLLLENPFLKLEYGCPAGNLTQEMTPWNIEFSKALNEIILEWQTALENCLSKAKDDKIIRQNVNPKHVALFITSGYWGIRNFGKIYNNNDSYYSYLEELKIYLENLR